MSTDYFQPAFPDMKPISSPPSLFTVNGVGFTMYGARDPMAGTYVATHFLCVFFIPIVALGAYRVADAHPGWYFLGKVPLSKLTRGWNWLVLLMILLGSAGIWWMTHANHPETIAARTIADGDRLAAEGKIGQAARKYQQVAMNNQVKASADALERLSALFNQSLDKASADELLDATVVGIDASKLNGQPKNVFEVILSQAKRRGDTDANTAWKLLDLIDPIAPRGDQQVNQAKKPILEKLLLQEPDNLDAISGLAVVYESEKRDDQCEKLLIPCRDKLGDREGARILGQILVNKGKFEEALPLLQAYTEERLNRLHAQEIIFNDAVKRVDARALAEIQGNRAPGFDFARLKELKHDPQAQGAMVMEYQDAQLRNDPEVKRTQAAMQAERKVVPVAIDLGIALLRRGQATPDPKARQLELQKAEQAFLRIKGVAGQTDEFRIFLGQVYYWLGKQAEGQKLFDELLQAKNRSGPSLLSVAQALRDVGSNTAARKLADEAYEKEPNGPHKDYIAGFRAVVYLDLDDRILWLTRIQSLDRRGKADLSSARGQKAFSENRPADAEQHLREALTHYAASPEHGGTLNNSAMAFFALYRITGDLKDMEQGIVHLEKAVALQPSDPILLRNAADSLLANSLRAVMGDEVDWKTLCSNGSLELLPYLYNDTKRKDQFRGLVRQHAGIAKARAYYERLLVLAPRNAYPYGVLHSLYAFLRDANALRDLQDRTAKSDLDHADSIRQAKEFRDDDKIEQNIKLLKNATEADDQRAVEARKAGGATLAVALARVVRNKISMQALDVPVDVDETVDAAEQAHQAAPSHATQTMLRDALLARAHRQLMLQDAPYAKMTKKCRHSLGPPYLIAIALGLEGSTQKACAAHPDVRRAQGLLKALAGTYDEDFGPLTWAMLRHTEPAWTVARTMQWQQNELSQLSRTIAKNLTPASTVEVYLQHWGLLMQGQNAEADAVLRRAAEQGIEMPK